MGRGALPHFQVIVLSIKKKEKPSVEGFNRVDSVWRVIVPKSVREQFGDSVLIRDIGDGLSELVDEDKEGDYEVEFSENGRILVPKELREKYDYRKKGFVGFLDRRRDEGVLMFPISKLDVPGIDGTIRLKGDGKFEIEKEDG